MNHNGVISLTPANAVTAGKVVHITNSNECDLSGAATDDVVGIVLHDVDPNETSRPVDVQLIGAGGVGLVAVDGAISAGSLVTNKGNGEGEDSGVGTVIGVALEDASAAGLIRVVF